MSCRRGTVTVQCSLSAEQQSSIDDADGVSGELEHGPANVILRCLGGAVWRKLHVSPFFTHVPQEGCLKSHCVLCQLQSYA